VHADAGVGCPDVASAWGLAQRCANPPRLPSAHASLIEAVSGCAHPLIVCRTATPDVLDVARSHERIPFARTLLPR
jgi:hypothetical protein